MSNGYCSVSSSYYRYSHLQFQDYYAWDVRFPGGFEFLDREFLSRIEALNFANRVVRNVRAAA